MHSSDKELAGSFKWCLVVMQAFGYLTFDSWGVVLGISQFWDVSDCLYKFIFKYLASLSGLLVCSVGIKYLYLFIFGSRSVKHASVCRHIFLESLAYPGFAISHCCDVSELLQVSNIILNPSNPIQMPEFPPLLIGTAGSPHAPNVMENPSIHKQRFPFSSSLIWTAGFLQLLDCSVCWI